MKYELIKYYYGLKNELPVAAPDGLLPLILLSLSAPTGEEKNFFYALRQSSTNDAIENCPTWINLEKTIDELVFKLESPEIKREQIFARILNDVIKVDFFASNKEENTKKREKMVIHLLDKNVNFFADKEGEYHRPLEYIFVNYPELFIKVIKRLADKGEIKKLGQGLRISSLTNKDLRLIKATILIKYLALIEDLDIGQDQNFLQAVFDYLEKPGEEKYKILTDLVAGKLKTVSDEQKSSAVFIFNQELCDAVNESEIEIINQTQIIAQMAEISVLIGTQIYSEESWEKISELRTEEGRDDKELRNIEKLLCFFSNFSEMKAIFGDSKEKFRKLKDRLKELEKKFEAFSEESQLLKKISAKNEDVVKELKEIFHNFVKIEEFIKFYEKLLVEQNAVRYMSHILLIKQEVAAYIEETKNAIVCKIIENFKTSEPNEVKKHLSKKDRVEEKIFDLKALISVEEDIKEVFFSEGLIDNLSQDQLKEQNKERERLFVKTKTNMISSIVFDYVEMDAELAWMIEKIFHRKVEIYKNKCFPGQNLASFTLSGDSNLSLKELSLVNLLTYAPKIVQRAKREACTQIIEEKGKIILDQFCANIQQEIMWVPLHETKYDDIKLFHVRERLPFEAKKQIWSLKNKLEDRLNLKGDVRLEESCNILLEQIDQTVRNTLSELQVKRSKYSNVYNVSGSYWGR